MALAYVTLGLGFLWVIPYIVCTFSWFYLDVKEKYRIGQEKIRID